MIEDIEKLTGECYLEPLFKEASIVFEKFKEGWSKSNLEREFGLNRRTIIRICRDKTAKE